MFKWLCLGVTVVFLVAVGWMLNDIRLQVRDSATRVRTAGDNINEHLPEVVAKSKETTQALSKHLPEVVEKVRHSTDTIAQHLPELLERANKATEVIGELAEDIRQLKELAGLTNTRRDENLVAYANGVMKRIETSGGAIGTKKVVGRGLKNPQPATEWSVSARKEALILAILVKSKKEMATKLAKTKLGTNWYIEIPEKDPVTLLDWLKQNHEETRSLNW